MRILFVCSRNQWRSPTAEKVFRQYPGWEVRSAGTAAGARRKVTQELLTWADLIFVMERKHQQRLRQEFNTVGHNRKIVVLAIPDKYRYMDPELIQLLKDAVKLFVPVSENPPPDFSSTRQLRAEKYND